ncbi:MAG: sigma-70 family RNA polymerase sigma factor [Saprospiraceae bacterium]|nr:sigma-70 family RNA polymerase sigma factor [Saprospiraceae bacterium]
MNPIAIIDNDADRIERVLRGDSQAFRELVNRHKDYAFTLAYRILNSREDAEEAAQDAFVRAYNGLATFNRDAKFTTWLYRIVVNCALTVQQRRKMQTEDIDNAKILRGGTNPSDGLKHKEQKFYIQKALKLLPPDDVTMITLFYLKENSLEEIADIVGIETNTVKVKLHRARKRLADVMQNLLKDEAKNLL